MAIDLSTYTRVFSDEFFDGYNAKNGKDVVLKPKNTGKLTFDGDVVVPASSVPGSITKDENGNVNLGSDQNEVEGTNSVVAGLHQNIDATNSFSIGNGHTMDGAIQSAIIGGQNNTNSKTGSVILGGYNITAYRDNTTYVPDLYVQGSQIFGVDPISRKLYGEFNRSFDDGTSMTVPHAATKTPTQTYVGYIKLVYCGTEDSEGSITSAKFDDTNLTCDGTWRELIIPTADHGLIIEIAGAGTFSYVAEINESVFDAEDENDGE